MRLLINNALFPTAYLSHFFVYTVHAAVVFLNPSIHPMHWSTCVQSQNRQWWHWFRDILYFSLQFTFTGKAD